MANVVAYELFLKLRHERMRGRVIARDASTPSQVLIFTGVRYEFVEDEQTEKPAKADIRKAGMRAAAQTKG